VSLMDNDRPAAGPMGRYDTDPQRGGFPPKQGVTLALKLAGIIDMNHLYRLASQRVACVGRPNP